MSVKILIVDDSRVERNYLAALVRKLGAEPTAAENCEAGVKAACEEKFDLMFIDYFMPVSDGEHTLRDIRQRVESLNKETPVIALGTTDYGSDSDYYFEHGFVNYIEKPVRFELLHAAMILYLPEEKREEMMTSAAAEPEHHESLLPDWLTAIPELSTADGVSNCGSEEDYLCALEIFYNSIDPMSAEIQGYYDTGDLKNYTIKVHALKSSARIIGLADLSQLAKELEAAGNAEAVDFIEQNTDKLLEWYRSYKEKFLLLGGDKAEEDDTDKPPADRDFLDDAFSSLDDFAGQMDYDLVEMVVNSVKEYSLEGRDKELFDMVDAAFLNLDWNGIRTASQKYFSEREE